MHVNENKQTTSADLAALKPMGLAKKQNQKIACGKTTLQKTHLFMSGTDSKQKL